MQHKVERSTLLHIAITNNKSRKFQRNGNGSQDLVKALAFEAMKSLKKFDRTVSDILIESSDA